jgi:hypothetical protein
VASARPYAVLFLIAGAVCAQTTPAPSVPPAPLPPVGPDAVWVAPEGFLATMHKACDKRAGDFGACFVRAMAKAGASPAAVAFARRTGDQGYLREFRSAGIVGIACAVYPFRANENGVCFLVNGDPPMLDVDDPKLIDQKALLFDRVYAGIAKIYPNVAIFPGRRFGETAAMPAHLRSGGQRFQVDYSLVDGCHACAHLGTMRMDFDFDVNGTFLGTKVNTVRVLQH